MEKKKEKKAQQTLHDRTAPLHSRRTPVKNGNQQALFHLTVQGFVATANSSVPTRGTKTSLPAINIISCATREDYRSLLANFLFACWNTGSVSGRPVVRRFMHR